jgi:ferrochelatase
MAIQRQAQRTAILVVNLGTPDAPTAKAVKPYLKQFLSDPRVVEIPKLIWWCILNLIILPIRSGASAKKYASIWLHGEISGSPLLVYSQKQAQALKKKLEAQGHDVMVEMAMRYGNPSLESTLERMRDAGMERLLVLPLYPQYSATTTASTFDEIFRVLASWRNQPELRIVKHYHDHPAYIGALKQQVESYWAQHGRPNFDGGDKLLFSFHGVPKRTLDKGDPYHCECHKTGRLLREALGLNSEQAMVTFQSRFGKAEWLKPYTAPTVKMLGEKKTKRLDIFCPGFPADCLETLEEIAMEVQEDFIHAGGGEYNYIACLNDAPAWIDGLHRIAMEHTGSWPLNSESPEALALSQERASELAACPVLHP